MSCVRWQALCMGARAGFPAIAHFVLRLIHPIGHRCPAGHARHPPGGLQAACRADPASLPVPDRRACGMAHVARGRWTHPFQSASSARASTAASANSWPVHGIVPDSLARSNPHQLCSERRLRTSAFRLSSTFSRVRWTFRESGGRAVSACVSPIAPTPDAEKRRVARSEQAARSFAAARQCGVFGEQTDDQRKPADRMDNLPTSGNRRRAGYHGRNDPVQVLPWPILKML